MGKEEKTKATLSGIPGAPPNLLAGTFVVFAVSFCWFVFITLHNYNGSLQNASEDVIKNLQDGKLSKFLLLKTPPISTEGFCLYFIWLLAQAIMYLVVPGPKGYGQPTPGGRVLEYNCNGLNSWILTHAVVLFCVYQNVFRGTILFDNWGTVFVLANICGFLISLFALVKAHLFPTHSDDRRFSGAIVYDFFMGIEHNPRLGNLDFKLFFNGRPGILMWTLINMSCAAKQYELYGQVTNSMILVNILHALYVLDFFYKEDWYLRTIDIAHDHFGFYLGWGDLVWLPSMYTIQAFYLVYNPVNLPTWAVVCILVLGISGYYIFRSVNSQKDNFRQDMKRKGTSLIWGETAKYIPAVYYTTDGVTHKSPLLISGWWGISRHFNYVGDLMGSLSYCLPCAFNHILPYFYIVYMLILLLHRIYRDDVRCREKYGKYWDYYCEKVPYKIFPFIY